MSNVNLKPCKRCGGEAEIHSFYSGVYDRIHGAAQCKQCKQAVWGKVSVNCSDVNTSAPDFAEWKKQAYEKVDKSIVEEWNKVMA